MEFFKQFCCAMVLLFASMVTAAEPKLLFAVDVIRHGDRTPVVQLPNSPYYAKADLGQLLTVGIQHEHQLGMHLRQRYVKRHHLLPDRYQPGSLYVRSTDKDRTIASAVAVLETLYPKSKRPKSARRIPIDRVALARDTLLHTHASHNPFAVVYRTLRVQHEWQTKTASLKEQMKRWSKASGIDLKSFREFNWLADNLYVREHNHVPLPKGISHDDAVTIMNLMEQEDCKYFSMDNVSKPMGDELLTVIAYYFDSRLANHNPDLKYVLFSAHDSTIMSVLGALHTPQTHVPRYASDLNFALFEDHGKHFVRITLNDKPVKIPGCDHQNQCSLAQLKGII